MEETLNLRRIGKIVLHSEKERSHRERFATALAEELDSFEPSGGCRLVRSNPFELASRSFPDPLLLRTPVVEVSR
ncbi:MAG: hypothetical protein KY444_03080, partial [Gemmatimonadetes bacterium]|nr:hypothetical protein [Gemmatimonadota bacterium]